MDASETKWNARITCEGETEAETTGHDSPEAALMALIALSIETWKQTGGEMDADFLETAAEVMGGIEFASQDCYAAVGGGMGKDFWTLTVCDASIELTVNDPPGRPRIPLRSQCGRRTE